MNILFIIKIKILMFNKWSYSPSPLHSKQNKLEISSTLVEKEEKITPILLQMSIMVSLQFQARLSLHIFLKTRITRIKGTLTTIVSFMR